MEDLLKRFRDFPGKTGFYYKNLAGGTAISHNGDLPFLAASVIKLPVLAEVFRQMEEGVLHKDDRFTIQSGDKLPSCGALNYMHSGLEVTLEDLYTLMIIHSDNTATNLLVKLVGMDNINRCSRSLGMVQTTINRLLFDREASKAGVENYITPAEIGSFLEKLYREELISPAADRTMLEILKKQRLNGKIPFMLPPKTLVAHKTGEDSGVTHDVGIVFGKRPFVVCFCGNEVEVPAFERMMQDVSLELYEISNK